jgi:hypothetical protein
LDALQSYNAAIAFQKLLDTGKISNHLL